MEQDTKKEIQSPNKTVAQEVKEQKYFCRIVGAYDRHVSQQGSWQYLLKKMMMHTTWLHVFVFVFPTAASQELVCMYSLTVCDRILINVSEVLNKPTVVFSSWQCDQDDHSAPFYLGFMDEMVISSIFS